MRTIGFLVNPIAGMGGAVGLKGTDGVLEEAVKRGAFPKAPYRAMRFLKQLSASNPNIKLLIAEGVMGEEEASNTKYSSVPFEVVYRTGGQTTRDDTLALCRVFLERKVDLVVFCGGDGTARDVCEVVGQTVPVVGIPAGVKMHSSVFANDPEAAAEVVLAFADGRAEMRDGEVMDVDEQRYRSGELAARLYGVMRVPYAGSLIQCTKCSYGGQDEDSAKRAIAEEIADGMDDGLYLLGPGTTVAAVADELGIEKTLLGVDAVEGKKLVGSDLSESDILELMEGKRARIVVTPIGAQGFIFGRGNQQLSHEVLAKVEDDDIIVAATPRKLADLDVLRVDTTSRKVDARLRRWYKVVSGYGRMTMKKAE